MENKTINKVKLATNFFVFCLGAANKVVNKIKQDKNKVKRLEVETPLAACLDLPDNGARNLAVAVGGNSLWCNFSSFPRQRRPKFSLIRAKHTSVGNPKWKV